MNTEKESRRNFVRGAATAAALAAVPLEPLLGGKESRAEASVISYNTTNRTTASFDYRLDAASAQRIDIGVLPDNGDSDRFADQSAWNSFTEALTSGNFTDFQNIIVGNPGGTNFTGTLNGPMASYAFDLEGLDSHATNVPPSPSVTSAQSAAEAVEHYWAALLRDVSFMTIPTTRLSLRRWRT